MKTIEVTTIALVPGTGTQIVVGMLEALGAQVNIITDMHDIRDSQHDGLILLGGRDICSNWYGEKETYSTTPDIKRDNLEWTLLRRAMTRHLPIMGICRGAQFLAVAHGASLIQDISRQIKNPGKHTNNEHSLTVTGPLLDVLPTKLVNSYHHQCIRFAPEPFKVLALAPDGIIESIWKPGVLGVQFHPELMFDKEYRWINLFRWFMAGLN